MVAAELFQDVDDCQTSIGGLGEDLDTGSAPAQQRQDGVDQLAALAGEWVFANAGVALAVARPSKDLAVSLFVATRIEAAGITDVVPSERELDFDDWVQPRAGVQYDLEQTLPTLGTLGLGLSPWGVVRLDLAGMVGDDSTYGAAAQLALTF